MDHRDRDPRPVRGDGPLPVGGVARGVEVAQHGLLLQQRLLALVQRDLQDARRRDQRGAPEAQHRRVGFGVGPEPGRRRRLDRRDDPAGAEQVAGERVVPVGQGEDAHLGLGLGALAQHEGAAEGVDVLNAGPGAVRDHLTPGRRVIGRAQGVVRSRQDPEVLGLLVGQDQEPTPAAGRRDVFDGVLDALAPRQDDAGLGQRVGGGDGQPLRRVRAVQADQHPGGIAGRPGPEREAPVGLLEHEHVAAGVAAQLVAPELERPLGLVHADVEHVVGRGRPGQAVPGPGHRLGGGRDARAEGPELELVPLVAADIGRIGQPVVVVADGGAAHGEVVRALRQHVLVEQDLLLLAGLARRGQLADPAGGAPAMDAVVLPLLGARVVPPGSPPGRHRHVGLFDPGLHLLEEARAEGGQRGGRLVGVGVLGLQVGQDLGILALAEPEPGILPVVAVGRNDVGAPGGAGRAGHRIESLPRLATRQ